MILHLSPYPCTLTLKLVKTLPEDVGGLVEYDKGNITMKLTLKDWEKYYIHEACHVVQAVEKYIEQKLGEEEEAYLIQYITDNIRKYITKNARKYVISDRKNKNAKTNFKRSETSSTLEKIQKRLDKGRNRKKLRCSH